jgi:hypothetical protein
MALANLFIYSRLRGHLDEVLLAPVGGGEQRLDEVDIPPGVLQCYSHEHSFARATIQQARKFGRGADQSKISKDLPS